MMCNFIFNEIGGYIICIETSSKHEKKLKDPTVTPSWQFLFHFLVEQLIICTWVEYSEIGIIFRIIINRKILNSRGVARVFGARGADFRLAPPLPDPPKNLKFTKICEIA